MDKITLEGLANKFRQYDKLVNHYTWLRQISLRLINKHRYIQNPITLGNANGATDSNIRTVNEDPMYNKHKDLYNFLEKVAPQSSLTEKYSIFVIDIFLKLLNRKMTEQEYQSLMTESEIYNRAYRYAKFRHVVWYLTLGLSGVNYKELERRTSSPFTVGEHYFRFTERIDHE